MHRSGFCSGILIFLGFHCLFAQNTVPANQSPVTVPDSISYYRKQGKPEKVLVLSQQWSEKIKAEKGIENTEYATAIRIMSFSKRDLGNEKEALVLLLESLRIFTQIQGENNLEVANMTNSTGLFYANSGHNKEAEEYYLKAIRIYEALGYKTKIEITRPMINLGAFYQNTGDYPKAETYLLNVLDTRRKILGEDHLELANAHQALGNLYETIGNYPKAESHLVQAYEINKKHLGESNPKLAGSLNNLGILYFNKKLHDKARKCWMAALENHMKNLPPDHPEIGKTYVNLGNVNSDVGNYYLGEAYYQQGLEILKKNWGEDHPSYSIVLGNLGNLYWNTGNNKKAESFMLRSLEKSKATLGESHPQTQMSQFDLGKIYFKSEAPDKAEALFLDWNAKKHAQIQRYFPSMSDEEKEQFYGTNLATYQDVFSFFCVDRYAKNKTIATHFYNDQLAVKGLLLNNAAKWKHRIKTSGDKKLFLLFTNWESNQNLLSKRRFSTDPAEQASIDSILETTEKMEKELSLRSENFARLAEKAPVTWKHVQKSLKPGEAAIEMVRVKNYGFVRNQTDTSDPKKPVYRRIEFTDSVLYAALIVKPTSVYPEMVLIRNGKDLEGKYLKFYKNAISNQLKDESSYKQFWGKIALSLTGINRIYFSPDGVYHNINLNTLLNPSTRKFLLEEKDIRLVTVTKDLVHPALPDEDNKLAGLLGYPRYYADRADSSLAENGNKGTETNLGWKKESFGNLEELPGTKIEVDKIGSILKEKGWEVKSAIGSDASEETIKESYKPRLLHIATHGFFQPDSMENSNPLLRSGLVLAGAGNTLNGEKKPDSEDGILTAYEAMNLNLDNTDLVVLSACETGLGEIKNGEGVYGLQRAFKVAGARSIIMSLWKVDDDATQELMVRFYKHWLSPPTPKGGANTTPPLGVGGPGLRSAFLKAQKELKAKYPDPYYWGAFVMVGE